MLGEKLIHGDAKRFVQRNDLPESFDARVQQPGKLASVGDQGNCGSCWAFGGAETSGNKFAIKGYNAGVFSVQDLVSCSTTCYS